MGNGKSSEYKYKETAIFEIKKTNKAIGKNVKDLVCVFLAIYSVCV
jgi:hypothetical protein